MYVGVKGKSPCPWVAMSSINVMLFVNSQRTAFRLRRCSGRSVGRAVEQIKLAACSSVVICCTLVTKYRETSTVKDFSGNNGTTLGQKLDSLHGWTFTALLERKRSTGEIKVTEWRNTGENFWRWPILRTMFVRQPTRCFSSLCRPLKRQ